MKNRKNKFDNMNERYLKEMESNNFLFEKKIRNLNESLKESNPKNSIQKQIINNNQEENYESDSENDISKKIIDEINMNNFTFNMKESGRNNINPDDNYNKVNENKELEQKIRTLERENNYKDFLINDLKKEIEEKNKKERITHINCQKCNLLEREIDYNQYQIKKLENNIKQLKLKIDNLIIDNKKLQTENDNLNNKIKEIISEAEANKIDSKNYLQKLNDLKLENKKINIDYLNLSNEYNILRQENEKLKSTIDEQNVIIFNNRKRNQFKSNTFKNNSNAHSHRYKVDNIYKAYISTEYDTNDEHEDKHGYKSYDKYNFTESSEENKNKKKNNIICKKNNYLRKKIKSEDKINNSNSNNIINEINDYRGSKYNYSKDDYYNDEGLFVMKEKNKEVKKSEINYLENYLNSLLKERNRLENELSDIPEHPQTLTDIKLRNNIKDKIFQSDNELKNIKQKLKKLRGY